MRYPRRSGSCTWKKRGRGTHIGLSVHGLCWVPIHHWSRNTGISYVSVPRKSGVKSALCSTRFLGVIFSLCANCAHNRHFKKLVIFMSKLVNWMETLHNTLNQICLNHYLPTIQLLSSIWRHKLHLSVVKWIALWHDKIWRNCAVSRQRDFSQVGQVICFFQVLQIYSRMFCLILI